jgi:hypothetical protein
MLTQPASGDAGARLAATLGASGVNGAVTRPAMTTSGVSVAGIDSDRFDRIAAEMASEIGRNPAELLKSDGHVRSRIQSKLQGVVDAGSAPLMLQRASDAVMGTLFSDPVNAWIEDAQQVAGGVGILHVTNLLRKTADGNYEFKGDIARIGAAVKSGETYFVMVPTSMKDAARRLVDEFGFRESGVIVADSFDEIETDPRFRGTTIHLSVTDSGVGMVAGLDKKIERSLTETNLDVRYTVVSDSADLSGVASTMTPFLPVKESVQRGQSYIFVAMGNNLSQPVQRLLSWGKFVLRIDPIKLLQEAWNRRFTDISA